MGDMQHTTFELDGTAVTVFPGPAESPVVYLNAFDDPDDALPRQMALLSCPACSLVIASGLNWNDDMTPWECPPQFKNEPPYGGKADDHLAWMTAKLLPTAEQYLAAPPTYRCLAGYSLAGLFTIYALNRSSLFTRAASVSGSLWYPDFLQYCETHLLCAHPACLYFSIGDKESRTRNQLMQTVQDRTEALAVYYRSLGIPATFELNPGNHFQDPIGRTARGIVWMLTNSPRPLHQKGSNPA